MASSDILLQTLSSITSIKLEEIINQRLTFEDGKAKLLKAVKLEPNQHEKIVSDSWIEDLVSTGNWKATLSFPSKTLDYSWNKLPVIHPLVIAFGRIGTPSSRPS